ncbi:MAG: hypothetical protein WDM76_05460 [Limisphaerales bacterium]
MKTTWRGTAGNFCTKVFVSRADNVVVMSITGRARAIDVQHGVRADGQ